ncbi:MAG: hypothetical protein ACXV7D_00465, partial [Thermoanaerobaculia bacterium]
ASPVNYYYVPQNFRARMATDAGDVNGYSAANSGAGANPLPYALADQYNHAMRYEDERALYDARRTVTTDGTTTGANVYPSEEPTFRLLVDDMYLHPAKYRNAIVLNLHGELFPFPPVRNFSDPAKIPNVIPGVRVVTHPEQLTYLNNQDVNLRVYAYLTDPAVGGNNWMDRPITITLKGINWAGPTASGSITGITGGVDFNGDGTPDAYQALNQGSTPVLPTSEDPGAPATRRMYYSVASGTDTTITLTNTPLRCPCEITTPTCMGKGLDPSARLYGLEYIPSPLESFDVTTAVPAFARGIGSFNGNVPKNTARWIITLPSSVLPSNSVIKIETRIGTDATTGTLFPTRNQPANLSSTYVWRGTDGSVTATDNWLYGTSSSDPNFPITERYQYLGDPRHSPYADNKRPHMNGGGWAAANINTNIGLGYNRYFDDFENAESTAAGVVTNTQMPKIITTSNSDAFPVTAANRRVVVNFTGPAPCNGVSAVFDIVLPTAPATTRTRAQVIADFNGNAVFTACATAGTVTVGANTFIQLAMRSGVTTGLSSMGFDTAASTADALVGFDSTTVAIKWPGWTYAAGGNTYGVKNDGTVGNDRWATVTNGNDGGLEIDQNRIYQTWRYAITRANAVYTTMTGFSYYYQGIGGEIGADSDNNFPANLPVNARPYSGTDVASFENSITEWVHWDSNNGPSGTYPDRAGVKYIVEGPTTNTSDWWGMNWLGELYPDNRYDVTGGVTTDWAGYGNLPTGVAGTNGAGTFRRILRENVPANNSASKWHQWGTTFLKTSRRTNERGSTDLFSAGSNTATFRHRGGGNAATLQTAGTQIKNAYNMQIDTVTPSNRPFYVDTSSPYRVNGDSNGAGQVPDDFLETEYGPTMQSGMVLAGGVTSEFYRQCTDATCGSLDTLPSSALLYTRNASSLSNTAFIVVNGLSQSGAVGANYIANWSFTTLIESFLWGGVYSDGGTAPNTSRITQLPQVVITSPNATTDITNPSAALPITWAQNWKRWDGRKYTPQYAAGFSESAALASYVMYSTDGVAWKYIQNDAAATPGVRPIYRHSPATTADNTLETAVKLTGASTTWDITNATAFPEGTYIIRVETYRDLIPLHYSYHQFRIFINRG